MTIFEDLSRKSSKNTSEKVPFLLVRFIWARKENEQDDTAKSDDVKTCMMGKTDL